MPDLFQYPVSFPRLWLDYYYIATWCVGMLFLGAGWAVFFRFGKFSYGVDFGCLWKSTLLVLMTTVALGFPNYYNTRFVAEHGQDGDELKLSADRLEYRFRNGEQKQFLLKDIVSIYQEKVTYNPPPKFFIVAAKAGMRDSVFVTKNLPEYEKLLNTLSQKTGVPLKRS